MNQLNPHDLEDEELEAYAEEYAAIVDFEDLDGLSDNAFDLSDMEDYPSVNKSQTAQPSRSKAKSKARNSADMSS
jgi:hypothetical protein